MNNNSTQRIGKSHYLCIGHACHDVKGNGFILGGTASYASIAAARLGARAAAWVSCGDDFLFESVFESNNVDFYKQKAAKTTIFENIYDNGSRTQYLRAHADAMDFKQMPKSLSASSIVHVCPIADEIDYGLLDFFPNTLIGLTPQGSMRQWDSEGKVTPKAMDWSVFSKADVVILSEDDMRGFEDALPFMVAAAKVLVVTKAARGADIYSENGKNNYPSFPIIEQDATGAGDVFAAAFFIKYAATKDVKIAASYAHVAASFVVEGVGQENVAALSMIDERYEMYQQMFWSKYGA
jgi:sugar/nucleoside kinase (ribokinase family)